MQRRQASSRERADRDRYKRPVTVNLRRVLFWALLILVVAAGARRAKLVKLCQDRGIAVRADDIRITATPHEYTIVLPFRWEIDLLFTSISGVKRLTKTIDRLPQDAR